METKNAGKEEISGKGKYLTKTEIPNDYFIIDELIKHWHVITRQLTRFRKSFYFVIKLKMAMDIYTCIQILVYMW